MDIFTRFNRKNIDDRQIDTLIGLSKGITADGKVDQVEAEVLLSWLIQSRQSSQNPIIVNLLARVSAFLEDGVLDDEEAKELLGTLRKIAGDQSEVGELAKSSALPLDEPSSVIEFPGKSFVFTGTCVYGTRSDCQSAVKDLGGTSAKTVTMKLDYLVLGTYVTDSWAHETYGRKIEKAMSYRDRGCPIAIVSEQHWLDAANLS